MRTEAELQRGKKRKLSSVKIARRGASDFAARPILIDANVLVLRTPVDLFIGDGDEILVRLIPGTAQGQLVELHRGPAAPKERILHK